MTTKVRITKALLADMPEQVRNLVEDWRSQYRKAFVRVERCTSFCAAESARVTMINLSTGKGQREVVAGEFAGFTRLSPTAQIPVPEGCVAVEVGFFCGEPFLTIHQHGEPEARQLSGATKSDWASEADADEQRLRVREDALCDQHKDRQLFRD